MERRTFFRTTGQTLAGAAILSPHLGQAAPVVETSPGRFSFASAPVLLNPAMDEVSIVIAVSGPATGWVAYGETEALGQSCRGEVEGFRPYNGKALRFRLTGLRPGQTYFYRVQATEVRFEPSSKVTRGAAVVTELRSFRTLDPAGETANFTIWNDTHENKETLHKLAAAHRAEPSDFLFWNGDVTNNIVSEQVLLEQYLNPAGEAYADRTPVFFTRGNHDVRGEAARLLGQCIPGPEGRFHYTFRQGPVACVVLDTGEDKPDEASGYGGLNDFAKSRAEQRAWLKKAIEDPVFKTAPFKIALMHIPLWWDEAVPEKWLEVWGGFQGWMCEDGRLNWHDLLEKAGIRFILSGHTHRQAWFPPRPERSYGQLTGGGPKPELATITRVQADTRQLRLTVQNLAGEALLKEVFSA